MHVSSDVRPTLCCRWVEPNVPASSVTKTRVRAKKLFTKTVKNLLFCFVKRLREMQKVPEPRPPKSKSKRDATFTLCCRLLLHFLTGTIDYFIINSLANTFSNELIVGCERCMEMISQEAKVRPFKNILIKLCRTFLQSCRWHTSRSHNLKTQNL